MAKAVVATEADSMSNLTARSGLILCLGQLNRLKVRTLVSDVGNDRSRI